jgi:nucleoporin SEH1
MVATVDKDHNDSNSMVLADSESLQILNTQHTDYILAVALDVYGRRLATVSGDRFVKIWDLGSSGDWEMVSSWQAHKSAVTCVDFAHPEFGNLLATCSSDHDVKVWEETTATRFTSKAVLTEARRGVSCCKFAPRHYGLQLATGSSDGNIRIYEAVDQMNLAQWVVTATLTISHDTKDVVLSWSSGKFDPPTIVAGSGTQAVIYRYSDQARSWQNILQIPGISECILDVAWAPNIGRRYHNIAIASEDGLRIVKLDRAENNELTISKVQEIPSTSTCWRCQWNVTGTVLASSGDGGIVALWKAGLDGEFACVSKVHGDLSKVGGE